MYHTKLILILCLLFYVSSVSGLKVALLFLGEFRSLLVCYPALKKYLYDHPVNQEHQIDTFITSYNVSYDGATKQTPFALKTFEVSLLFSRRMSIFPPYTPFLHS